MLARIVSWNSAVSWLTSAIARAQRTERRVAHVDAVDRHAAGIDVEEARRAG
jgi:hypothetical protein